MVNIIKFITGSILILWDILIFFIRLVDGGDRQDSYDHTGINHNLNTGDIDVVKRADSTYAGDHFVSPQERHKRI